MSFIIDISDLRHQAGAKKKLDLLIEDVFLPEDISLLKPMLLSLEITNTGLIYHLQGQLSAEIKADCSRCLEPVIFPLENNFTEKLIYNLDLKQLGDFDQEQYRVFDWDDRVDITEIVLEYVFAVLPFKFLCSTECRGLCAKCSRNLNIEDCDCQTQEFDPRLAVLADLKID